MSTPATPTGAPPPATPSPASTAPTSPSADDLLLDLQDVHTYYGHIHALQGISLSVRRGEVVTLIGANGAGKTTTLKTISGLLHARQGSVTFDGRDITKIAAHHLVKAGIGHAPEGRRIFPRLTVLENLQMGAFTRKGPEIKTDVDRVMELFPRLRERTGQLGGTLSGGEQQMLAIGRALMNRPTLLFLDEPSLGLSPILVKEIFEIIRIINREGMTILLVEQNARMALSISHFGLILENGRFVMKGDAGSLLANKDVREFYMGIRSEASVKGYQRWKRKKAWR
jgi:branched-chain amino acid transport system ATP-binding protein